MRTLLWILTLVALGLWSLAAWGTHTLVTLDPAVWAGSLDGVGPMLDRVPHADLLNVWIPGWREIIEATVALTRTVVGWLGGAGGVLGWVVWAVWGLGVAVMLTVAGVLSLLISAFHRRQGPPSAATA